MPDMDIPSVLDWFQHEEPGRPDLLEQPATAAERRPEVIEGLVRLGKTLDVVAAGDDGGLALAGHLRNGPIRDDLRTIMGQVGFPRALRLVAWLMQAGLPETDAILAAVMEPDPSGSGQYLQAALTDAARPTLLERIYAPNRVAALLAACAPVSAMKEAA